MRLGLIDFLELPAWLKKFTFAPRAEAIFAELDQVIAQLLASRAAAPVDGPAKDLLARLIAARDEETGRGMTAEEMRNQIITIFLAGHETTSQALTWTWYLLSQHPAAEARLHAELDHVLGGRTPRHEDLAKLPFTRMVIEESMRLYPPAHALGRTAIHADEVRGRRVRPGTSIIISPWLLHRNPKLWERPERFEPERFAAEHAAARHRFAYIPFGAGPRICIGAAFAMAEGMLILAAIAQRYRLRLKPGFAVEPQALITLRPRHGMRMILERR
jgi:cytochrome P450